MPPTPVAPVPRPVNGSIPYPPPNLVVPPPLRYSPSVQPVRAVFAGPGMPANDPLPLMHPPPYSATYATPPNVTYPAPPPYPATPAPRMFLEPPDLFELRPVEPPAPPSEYPMSAYPSDPMNPRVFRDFPPEGENFEDGSADGYNSDDPEDPEPVEQDEGYEEVDSGAVAEGGGDGFGDIFVERGGDEEEGLRRIRDWAEDDGGLATIEEDSEGVEDSACHGDGVGVVGEEGDGDGGVGEGDEGDGDVEDGGVVGDDDAGAAEGGVDPGAGVDPDPGDINEGAEPMPAPEPVSRRTRSSGQQHFSRL